MSGMSKLRSIAAGVPGIVANVGAAATCFRGVDVPEPCEGGGPKRDELEVCDRSCGFEFD